MNEFQKAMQQAKRFIAFYQQIHLPLMRVTSKDRCLIFHQNEKKGLGLWCQRAYISEDFREAWLLQSPRICLSVYGVDLYHP